MTITDTLSVIGYRARLRRGWSVEQLATRAGVSGRTVRRFEFGTPLRIETTEKILAVLHVDVRIYDLHDTPRCAARAAAFRYQAGDRP